MATDSTLLSLYDGSWVTTLPAAELNGQLETASVVFLQNQQLGDAVRLLPSEAISAFTLREVPFPELPGTIGLKGLRFLTEPIPGSPGSQAQSLVVHATTDRAKLELIQFLPPHAVTSVHYHEREDEWFFSLAGSCELWLGTYRRETPARAVLKERVTLRAVPLPDTASVQRRLERAVARHAKTLDPTPPFDPQRGVPEVYVRPGTVHQLRTADEPALNLIRIRATDATKLPELAHRYVEWEQ